VCAPQLPPPLSPSQHMEPWLKSEKSHERKRAVQSIFLLLQHIVDKLKLAVSPLCPLCPLALGSSRWEGTRSTPDPGALLGAWWIFAVLIF
jgi:hypothetical protein